MIFYQALRHQGKPTVEFQDQLFLYVGGEGGTGKSRVIEAVRLGKTLLQRQNEALVLAPTGNAAKNVQGSTIHTGFGCCSAGSSQKRPFNSREVSLVQQNDADYR